MLSRLIVRRFRFWYREGMKIMIGLRVTKEFKKLLQDQADEENRSLSNFVIHAVITYLREKGIDWKEPGRNS